MTEQLTHPNMGLDMGLRESYPALPISENLRDLVDFRHRPQNLSWDQWMAFQGCQEQGAVRSPGPLNQNQPSA